ncbi:MAG: chain-length determining protein [Bacteroidaceae bacterium]|nr:chain-length determining protein [Bacteroidaceae bacterium]
MEKSRIEYIDPRKVIQRVWQNRTLFYKALPVVFVASCALMLCIPRYYTTSLKVVPEMGSQGMGSSLGDLAASFGFNLGEMETSDAITPVLYPDLLKDNGFIADLYNIPVKSDFDPDRPIDTTYFGYMCYYQKEPFWNVWRSKLKKLLKRKKRTGGSGEYDPYHISFEENALMMGIRNNISIDMDKKTGVITISTQAQDPIICRTLADSVKSRLQTFIIQYRTSKARNDMEYYGCLMESAKRDYEMAVDNYARMADANRNVLLVNVQKKIDDLENEMQLTYNTYTAMKTQYEACRAKVQECTPVFTDLQRAAVPVKHAGPKRMITVAFLMFLACCCLVAWLFRKELLGGQE